MNKDAKWVAMDTYHKKMKDERLAFADWIIRIKETFDEDIGTGDIERIRQLSDVLDSKIEELRNEGE